MVYNIKLSKFERNHVIDYIKEKKILNPEYKVIDIGGSEEGLGWAHEVIDYVIDFNEIKNDKVKLFKFNINYESQWKEVLEFVEKNGKFDFCICSHTLEDISVPSVPLSMMPFIANEGFISTPSKFAEFSKIGNQPWLGYIHHRWIFTFKNNVYLMLPKLNFIEHIKEFQDMGTPNENLYDLSFFWKDSIEFEIINNDYMGPSTKHVINYYSALLNDDINLE